MSAPTLQKLQHVCALARVVFGDSAIVSGGAPRDVLSGVPVKDIDIFVKLDESQLGKPDSDFVQQCSRFALLVGGESEMRLSNESYINCFDLCDITKDGVKGALQIIGVAGDPVDDVPKYDFDLSQVFVTPNGLFATEAAWRARANRVITFTPSASDEKALLRSKARLERLRAKYQGWAFQNVDGLDAIAEPADLGEVLA
jgi:hypothetical protein